MTSFTSQSGGDRDKQLVVELAGPQNACFAVAATTQTLHLVGVDYVSDGRIAPVDGRQQFITVEVIDMMWAVSTIDISGSVVEDRIWCICVETRVPCCFLLTEKYLVLSPSKLFPLAPSDVTGGAVYTWCMA